jgi:hypothetical protein
MAKENLFNIFISYEWELIDQVIKLYDMISNEIVDGVWLDKYQLK